MADGTVPERVISHTEQETGEMAPENLKVSVESVDEEAIKAEIEQEVERVVSQTKEYAMIANDSADPSLGEEVKIKTDALEVELRAAAVEAQTKIDRLLRGEPAPELSPEAAIADLKKENVSAATGETATIARTEEGKEPLPEQKEDSKDQLISRFGAIIEEYKGANHLASRLLQKKLLKLMIDTNPEMHPNDVRLAELRSMIGRLKMAFDGDANAWEPSGGVRLENDFASLKESFQKKEI